MTESHAGTLMLPLVDLANDFGIDAPGIRAEIEKSEKPSPKANAALTRGKKSAETVADLAEIIGKTSPTVKYVHPVHGETWSGRGKPPMWVKLWIDAGNKLESLLPDAAEKNIADENSSYPLPDEDPYEVFTT